MSDQSVAGQWEGMLKMMLTDFREKHPEDSRTDRELLEDFMEHLVKVGTIKKEGGKFVLPKIV